MASREQRIERLAQAFDRDGFDVSPEDVVDSPVCNDRIGLIAHHRTATNYDTGQPKAVYYVEGTPAEIGFLCGYLAPRSVSDMTTSYIDNALWEMVTGVPPSRRTKSPSKKEHELHSFLIELISKVMRLGKAIRNVPDELKEELAGIREGCLASDEHIDVPMDALWVLNAGFDCLLAHVYTLKLPKLNEREIVKLLSLSLRAFISCNALALLNGASRDGPLFGRDFMFPTGDVFQKHACLTVYQPISENGNRGEPIVSMNAPGMVGSIAALNTHGTAAGVDVVPAAVANPDDLGLNSLLMVRHAIGTGTDVESVVRQIVSTRRGVPWLYPVAGAGSGDTPDHACTVEAGASTTPFNPLEYSWRDLRRWLPKRAFLDAHKTTELNDGAAERWETYSNPMEYIEAHNPKLWKNTRNVLNIRRKLVLYEDAFTRLGRINRTHDEANCPSSFYFAPLRALHGQVVITSNHYVVPEMRLCSMGHWIHVLAGAAADDSQWRYDELGRQTLLAMRETGDMSYADAKRLIDFLAPYGEYPHYYEKLPRSEDGQETAIGGSVSLFDLKQRTIESHFGYYCDDWIKLTLPNYVL